MSVLEIHGHTMPADGERPRRQLDYRIRGGRVRIVVRHGSAPNASYTMIDVAPEDARDYATTLLDALDRLAMHERTRE